MTATDELRRMLTEAGVEYRFNDATKVFEWHFDGTDGEGSAHATEVDGGINIIACSLTPEQAISATVGRGTCKPTTYDNYLTKRLKPGEYYEFWEPACACSECGELIPMRRFCPNCGARIEVDE